MKIFYNNCPSLQCFCEVVETSGFSHRTLVVLDACSRIQQLMEIDMSLGILEKLIDHGDTYCGFPG